eukprot:ANDGO_06217.mRNA.1 hypothetical protein
MDDDWQVVDNRRKDTKRSVVKKVPATIAAVPSPNAAPNQRFASLRPTPALNPAPGTPGASPAPAPTSAPPSVSLSPTAMATVQPTSRVVPQRPESIPVPSELASSSIEQVAWADIAGSTDRISSASATVLLDELLMQCDHSDGFSGVFSILGVLYACPSLVDSMDFQRKSRILDAVRNVTEAKERKKSAAVHTSVFLEPLHRVLSGNKISILNSEKLPVVPLGSVQPHMCPNKDSPWTLPGTERFLKTRFFANGLVTEALHHGVDSMFRKPSSDAFLFWPANVTYSTVLAWVQEMIESPLMQVVLAVAVTHGITWGALFSLAHGDQHGVYMDFDFSFVKSDDGSHKIAMWLHQVAPHALVSGTPLERDVVKAYFEKHVRPFDSYAQRRSNWRTSTDGQQQSQQQQQPSQVPQTEEEKEREEEIVNTFVQWYSAYESSTLVLLISAPKYRYQVISASVRSLGSEDDLALLASRVKEDEVVAFGKPLERIFNILETKTYKDLAGISLSNLLDGVTNVPRHVFIHFETSGGDSVVRICVPKV